MASVSDSREDRKALARLAREEVAAVADILAVEARAELLRHRKSGVAQIEVTHGRVDSEVALVDPDALSIEFGHGEYTRKDGRTVGKSQGLNVIGKLL